MKISARNQLKGIIKGVTIGAVNAEIVIEIAPGVEVTSIITKAACEGLGLEIGMEAYAVVKASSILVATDA